jgi:sulfur carrier protein ThiS
MRITLRLGDPLWRKVGQRRLDLELAEGQTAADALALFTARYPAAGADLLPDGQSAQERLPYHLFVNHRKIPWEAAGATPLRDGDQVVVFLIVVGG